MLTNHTQHRCSSSIILWQNQPPDCFTQAAKLFGNYAVYFLSLWSRWLYTSVRKRNILSPLTIQHSTILAEKHTCSITRQHCNSIVHYASTLYRPVVYTSWHFVALTTKLTEHFDETRRLHKAKVNPHLMSCGASADHGFWAVSLQVT